VILRGQVRCDQAEEKSLDFHDGFFGCAGIIADGGLPEEISTQHSAISILKCRFTILRISNPEDCKSTFQNADR
jgi:hypothetical protein